MKVLPAVDELFDGRVGISDIRPLTEADLLGRREIRTDLAAISSYLTNKRVLVTGAGGSIGSELCRQVHQLGPSELVLLDRDESALHAVELSLRAARCSPTTTWSSPTFAIAAGSTRSSCATNPTWCLHAAALKHLPLLEMHPEEALKTNVWGTQQPARPVDRARPSSASSTSPPTRPLNRRACSATRSASPSASPRGPTRRPTARISACASATCSAAAARCSPRFRHQVDAGGPITVTDPDVTRYFMTVEEAVQLVIQAGAIGGDGDVLVLEMGEPVRIADVARRMAEQSDRTIEIVFTGSVRREAARTAHRSRRARARHEPRADHRVQSMPLDPALLDDLNALHDQSVVASALAELSTIVG